MTPSVLFGADRFWIAGAASNWNDANNWASSSGGAGGAGIPGSGDVAIFDGSGLGDCNIDVNVDVQGISIRSGYVNTVSQNSFTIDIGTSGFVQADGNFSGGTARILISQGTYTLSGGAFTSTSDTIEISGTYGGNFTAIFISGGTFNHNGGTVNLFPSLSGCGTRTVRAIVANSPKARFQNFIANINNISCTEDRFSVASGDTLIVEGDFVHEDGFLYSGVVRILGDFYTGTEPDGGFASVHINGGTDQDFFSQNTTGRTAHFIIDKSGGTFGPGLGQTDLACQMLSLVNGTFTAPPGSMFIGGSWAANFTILDQSGGTFNHNNGKVFFDPDFSGCGTRTASVSLSATPKMQFYDVEIEVDNISCTEDRFNIPSGDTLIVINDYTHRDGFVNTGVIRVEGDLFLESGADGGTATIHVSGANVQEYNNSSTARFSHILVDKSGNSISAGAGTTDLYCTRFSLFNGTFDAPSGNFYIGGTWATNVTLLDNSGGTFNHNNGKVNFDPDFSGCGTRTASVSLTAVPKMQFYDVEIDVDNISCTEDRFNIPAGDTLIVINDYTHRDGFVNTGVVSVQGDLFLESGADGGTATIHVVGGAVQEYNNLSTARFSHILVDKSANTLSPGAGTTDLYCTRFSLYNGTFNAPAGVFYIGGTWATNVTLLDNSGGTFNHNNGKVNFDPDFSGCGTRTASVSLTATPKMQFFDLEIDVDNISCTEDRFNIPSGDTLIVINDYTHRDGFVNTGVVSVQGDLFLESGADGGTATIHVIGGAVQEYNNLSTARFSHILVDKSANSLSPGAGTIDLRCTRFSLYNGIFNAPTGVFYIGGTWSTNVTLLDNSGGTFNNNNGQVIFDPDFAGCGTRTASVSLTAVPKMQFYDLEIDVDNISCTEDRFNIPSGDTLIVLNDYTHRDGFVNTGVVRAEGDLFLESGADGGTATIHVTGANVQTYNNSSTARFSHILVDKSGNALSPGVGTTDLRCTRFSHYNGVFNAPPGVLYIGGTWSTNVTLLDNSGGTFNNNNGMVIFDPDFAGCGTRTASVSLTAVPKMQFYDLEIDVDNISCTEDIFNIPTGDTLIVLNDYVHRDGFVNTGVVRVEGDLFLESGADGGTATIHVTGSNIQEYNNLSTSRFSHILIDKSGNALSPGAGTTDLRCSRFSMYNGTFNAPTGSFNIGGPWASNFTIFRHDGGTFNHNNGEVNFDPDFSGCGLRTATIDFNANPTIRFNDLYVDIDNISCTEDRLSGTNLDTLVVEGLLTLNDGQVNTLILLSLGDVDINANLDAGTSPLIFGGTTDQSIDATGAISRFAGDVFLNKSSGELILATPWMLNTGGQFLNFVDGIISTTSTNVLIFGDNGDYLGSSNASFVQGPVWKIGNDAFVFPVGKNDTILAEIGISAPSTLTDTFSAEYFFANPDDDGYDTSMHDPTILYTSATEYWILDRVGGTSDVFVTLSWCSNCRSGTVLVPADLVIAKWNGALWEDEGNGGTTGTPAAGTITTQNAVSSFSPFTLASVSLSNPLPVDLLSFGADAVDKHVSVHWETFAEIMVSSFVIERSEDGIAFEEIGIVDPIGGGEHFASYAFRDLYPFEGLSYYRLKIIYEDGSNTYSDNDRVYFGQSGLTGFNIYPNPAAHGTVVQTSLELSPESNIELISGDGKRYNIDIIALREIKIPSLIEPGLYMIRIKDGSGLRQEKLIIRD